MFKLASLVALVTLAVAPASAQNFDRAAWIADFEQAKAAITDHSPNLDWALARGMDLPALETLTRARLDASTDDAAARRALDRFIAAFGDGHMEIAWPSHAPAPTTTQTPPDICGSIGFWTSPDTGAIGMHLSGYESVTPEHGVIEAGIAPVGGSRIGVVRIDQFAPSALICARALGELSLSPTDPCDELCADQVQRRADALFLDEVAARIRAIAAQRPRALMIDLAQNGGGSSTAIAIARMVVGTRLAAPVMGVARSPERALDLQETADFLAAQSVDPDTRAFLAPLLTELRRAQQEAATPCDLGAIWAGARPNCSNLVLGPFYAGGLVAEELPQRFRSAPWAEYVSETAGYQYQPELWRGPVIVLVDRYSA